MQQQIWMFCFLTAAAISSFRYCSAASGSWPAPESLVAFWPLDSQSQLSDVNNIANRRRLRSEYLNSKPKLMIDFKGPFEKPGTSYSVQANDKYIGGGDNLPALTTFTFSFYYYSQMQGRGGIAQFIDSYSLGISSLAPNVLELLETGRSIGKLPILQANTWNFVAVTYDGSRLAVYDNQGSVLGDFTGLNLQAPTYIGVGWVHLGLNSPGMNVTDAMACVMLYQTVLTSEQIAQLPEQCRTRGGVTPQTQMWPRPESLAGFWPLSAQYQGQDISDYRFKNEAPVPSAFPTGPFGDMDTAASPDSDNTEIVKVTNSKLVFNESFTVTMFISRGEFSEFNEGGIFQFQDNKNTVSTFQVRYINATTIQVGANKKSIGYYHVILPKGVWTFLAFTLDKSKSQFLIYGRHGVIGSAQGNSNLIRGAQYNNNGLILGKASQWKQGLRTTDAVSCLMVYSTALTPAELLHVIEACRIVHGSAPCGSPKLALSALPSTDPLAKIPKPGQFPYVVSIRRGTTHICSASIIDAFWLLSAAKCFVESKDPSSYKVYAGEYNLDVDERHTTILSISKILTPAEKPHERDPALIELSEPIDFTGQYVNDVCLYRGESPGDGFTLFEEVQLFFGWGKNGRRQLHSPTLPRYLPLSPVADEKCASSNADLCFATASDDKNAPCSGDEGGPLLVQVHGAANSGSNDYLAQIAVFYKREEGCSPSDPSIFANIANYNTWITEQIACVIPGLFYPAKCQQEMM